MLAPALKRLRKRFDYETYGGAPLLGLRGNCIVTHGRASRNAHQTRYRRGRPRSQPRRRRKDQRAHRTAPRGHVERPAVLGVYVHLPFCPYLCPYCDFAKWPLRASGRAALSRRAPCRDRARAAACRPRRSTSAAEPRTRTMQRPSQRCSHRCAQRFTGRARSLPSSSIPSWCARAICERIARPGITRFRSAYSRSSLTKFERSGANTPSRKLQTLLTQARAAHCTPFRSISSLPYRDRRPRAGGGRLRAAIALEVDHISAYGLTVEEGTPYATWHAREPGAFFDDAREARALRASRSRRSKAPGTSSTRSVTSHDRDIAARTTCNYWANGEYVGLGVGAASYRDGRAQRSHALA